MLLNSFSRNRRRKNNNCGEPRWQSQSALVWLLAMSWFRRKISLVPSIKIIVLSTLLAPATLIITHTATKIHTLRPHWQMSYFFKIAQRGKISQKGRKTNSIFLRFHVGVKWGNLIGSVWLGYRKTPAIHHVKCHGQFLSSFWRNHGYFPR